MECVVGLGANLGDRALTLAAAASALGARFTPVAVSSLYETAPVGPPQPAYLNAALRLEVDVAPLDLLGALLEVERRHGRERRERWGPRTLDLDVLWIRGLVVDEPALVVPHPHLHERRFALEPLVEVCPDAANPLTGVALTRWLEVLPPGGIRRIEAPAWDEAARNLLGPRMRRVVV